MHSGDSGSRWNPTLRRTKGGPPADVYEAVLRYQVESWELAADSYCVEVSGKDANRALLERFKPLLRVKGALPAVNKRRRLC